MQGHQKKLASAPGLKWAFLFPAALLLLLLTTLYSAELPLAWSWSWIPALGIEFGVYIDGLAAQFLLLITGVGTLVFIYGSGYLLGHPKILRVFILLSLFMLAMIGAVISDNLILLFVFWELTSVLSFLLVGFDHEKGTSRQAAQQAMLVTGFGGLALLAGVILMGMIAGTYSLQELLHRAPSVMLDPRLNVALTLIFIGAFTKSAQFPFFFWLPNAMSAPTPVSAYLHSATMVKLGIYLLARLDAAFSDLVFWENVLVAIGTLTAVLAAIQTLYERDLKRILAWSTVATLGTLVMLVGLPGSGAALATSALVFAHALYKAPLFFVAGNLDHGAGTRQIDKLTGMRRYLPWTAAVALLAALSMAGLPLTFGFVAKDAITLAKAQAGGLQLVGYSTVFVNGISMAVAAIAALRIFWGRDVLPRRAHPHEAGFAMLLPPFLLVILGLLFGLRPTLVDPVLGAAAAAMYPGFEKGQVQTAYDIIPVIEATLAAIACGALFYWRWDWLHRRMARLHHFMPLSPETWYKGILSYLPRLAAWITRRVQHGLQTLYLLSIILWITFIVQVLLWLDPGPWSLPTVEMPGVPIAGAVLLIVGGALASVCVRDHLVLLLVGGLVGYGSAILFLFSGAPDLALTQFIVETVFVVVVASVLARLHQLGTLSRTEPGERGLRWLPLFAALLFAATLSMLLLLVSGIPFDNSLGEFFALQSLSAAHGRNVVNVILVDFRALDTLGEIAVLGFAFLAALPLLSSIGRRRQ